MYDFVVLLAGKRATTVSGSLLETRWLPERARGSATILVIAFAHIPCRYCVYVRIRTRSPWIIRGCRNWKRRIHNTIRDVTSSNRPHFASDLCGHCEQYRTEREYCIKLTSKWSVAPRTKNVTAFDFRGLSIVWIICNTCVLFQFQKEWNLLYGHCRFLVYLLIVQDGFVTKLMIEFATL